MFHLYFGIFRKANIRRKRDFFFLIAFSFTITMLIGLKLNMGDGSLAWSRSTNIEAIRKIDAEISEIKLTDGVLEQIAGMKYQEGLDYDKIDLSNLKLTEYGLFANDEVRNEEENSYERKRDEEKETNESELENYPQMTSQEVVERFFLQKQTDKNVRTVFEQKLSALYGVSPEHYAFYNNNSTMFTCINGETTIPKLAVNDNYCDCTDGSDEPGTSACPNSRFFCVIDRVHILSSRVNDGVCDCCDGSDEWKLHSPIGFIKPKNPVLHYAPCPLTC